MAAGGNHVRMSKQSQVKTAAAVLIAGATMILAACSSGTSSTSATKAAAPSKTAPAASASASASAHSGSAMAHAGSSTAHAGSPTAHAGSPTPNHSTCKQVDSLRTSLQDLTHLTLNATSVRNIRTDLTKIQTHVNELKKQGGNSALSSQVNQLSASLDNVKKAANGLSTPPSTAQITAVVTSLTQLKAQSKTALAAMDAACPK